MKKEGYRFNFPSFFYLSFHENHCFFNTRLFFIMNNNDILFIKWKIIKTFNFGPNLFSLI